MKKFILMFVNFDKNRDNDRVIPLLISISILLIALQSPIKVESQIHIEYGENVQGTIAAPSEIDVYTFDGTINEIITVLVARSSNIFFTPMVELYDPDGVRLRRISGNTLRIDTLTLQKSGVYKIWVLDDNFVETGNYGLSLDRVNPPRGTSIVYGTNLQGSINSAADIKHYTFTGNANEIITVLVARSSNIFFTPMVELYDPDGLLLRRTAGNTIRIDTLKLTKEGIYTILVLDDNGIEGGGYGLSLWRLVPPLGTQVACGINLQDTIKSTAHINAYIFCGKANDIPTILVSRTSNIFFTTMVEVYDPEGQLLQRVAGNSIRIDTLKLSRDGLYTVLVLDDNGVEGGTYGLTIICQSNSNCALPVTLLYFKGKWQQNNIQLTWATSFEQNNKEFIIERSLDGSIFSDIESVPAKFNSTQIHNYSCIDKDVILLNKNTVYYKLKQVDVDGNYQYSNVLAITIHQSNDKVKLNVYPNPFTKIISLQVLSPVHFGQKDRIELYSAAGTLLFQQKLVSRASNTIVLDKLPQLSPGIYLLKTIINEKVTSFKLIRQ